MFQDMRVGAPMERLHLDLTGPHPPVSGLTYICTAMCAFTKLAVAWPIRDKKATTVAKGLMERVVLPLGAPRMLLTTTAGSSRTSYAMNSADSWAQRSRRPPSALLSVMAASKDGIPP